MSLKLSPGEFYKLVPVEPEANARYRVALIEACRRDPVLRAGVMEACRQDIVFWINTFGVQFNPDNIEHEVEPFVCYPFQVDALLGRDLEDGTHRHGILECIEDQEDARWPKSRKMGASWLALFVCDWLSIFFTHKITGVISRDEDSVDKYGDPNSLFWKLDFMNEHLPDWMKGPITRRKMSIVFDRTRSSIIGEANTVSAFVSGRCSLMLIDEFGQFKNGAETFDMTSDVAMARLFVFTHKDQAGMAYDLCFDSKYVEMREIITHWSMHPERNKGLYRYNDETHAIDVIDKLFSYPDDFQFVYESKPAGGPYPGLRSPWYDHQCRRRSERDVAMNLDIDPRGASDKFFDPHRIKILQTEFCYDPVWTGTLVFDAATGKPIELVEAIDGLVKLWINPMASGQMPPDRYGAGADIAAGTGATPSCLSVFSATTGHKVLEYANALIFANNFAEFCCAILRLFLDRNGTPALLGWEMQGGNVFDRRIRELSYQNCYIRRDEDSMGKPRDNKGRAGVNTSGASSLPMLNNYRDALYSRTCVNHSEWALNEAMRFVHTKRGVEYRGTTRPKKQGDEGSSATLHHGDIVTSDFIGWKMIEELGVSSKIVEVDLCPPGSLAWRRKFADNRRRREEDGLQEPAFSMTW